MTTIKKVTLVALALGSIALSACHTMDGAGEDVSAAGHSVQRASGE